MLDELITVIAKLYDDNPDKIVRIPAHEGGRNTVYRARNGIIRVSSLLDRTYEDFLAETEYVRYLAENGASVANVISSVSGNLVERLTHNGKTDFVCAFEIAKGDQLAAHGYRYRDGAPLCEYFYNCGKTLGKIHALSKTYKPLHKRFDFFDQYSEAYLSVLIPSEYPALKDSMHNLLGKLRALPKDADSYGMIHFDFSDGNYMIDYDTGEITAFDFDNCRTGWYLFDLANLWTHGVGWVAREPDADKRKAFMQNYFASVLEGYRSETKIDDAALKNLPLLIQAVLMENIIDEFEVQKSSGEAPEVDEEQAYRMECLIRDIPYVGFFDQIYSWETPFCAHHA